MSGETEVELHINGQTHRMTVDIRSTLLDLLRERLHMTGTKKGVRSRAVRRVHGVAGR